MSSPGEGIAQAYLDACLTELRALKPGNVHVYADGHDMTVREFEASAQASAPAMGHASFSVGERVHEAIRRTRDVVDCNTNLGIVLLCAPLAAAAFNRSRGEGLRDALRRVLATLDVDDAEQAFAAIRLAAPGGLGEAPEHDVRDTAAVTLRAAMNAARARDRIALQYVTDYRDVYELGVPRLEQGLARWNDLHWATTFAYLGYLAAFVDAHVARKYGADIAEDVRRRCMTHDAALQASARPESLRTSLLAFDAELKTAGHNPGTSADLTVASLFALSLERSGLM